MKKILIGVIIVFTIIIASCDNVLIPLTNPVEGVWQTEDFLGNKVILSLNKDWSFEWEYFPDGNIDKGDYELRSDTITFIYEDGESEVFLYEIMSERLILKWDSGLSIDMIFTRVD